MKKALFRKIKNHLDKNSSVQVKFIPHHKGCEISLDQEVFQTDYDFYVEHFDEWFYNELSELLIKYDAFGRYIDVEFQFEKESLVLIAILTCPDDEIADDTEHSKEEIITPLLISTISNNLKISNSEFDTDSVEFDIEFDGSFKAFNIYYDESALNLSAAEQRIVQNDIINRIKNWRGSFFGSNYQSMKTIVSIGPYDYDFICTDIVTYKFVINPEE